VITLATKRIIIGLSLMLGLHLGARGQDYFPPPDTAGGWRTLNDPAQIRKVAGMDVRRLDEAFAYTERTTQHGGLLVLRHGWLVYERYFGKGNREADPQIASVSKAFSSIACGIMLKEKHDLIPQGLAFHDTDPPTRTALTPDEQYTYMSMWSLMASPLFYSGVMSHLDAFTQNVLCNSEVIDIDQDVLGKQAKIVRHAGQEFVLAKPLEGGALAVGLFNLAGTKAKLTVTWQELGLMGRCRVRDVWRQKDIGDQVDQFSTEVNPHGVGISPRLKPLGRNSKRLLKAKLSARSF